MSDSNSYSKGDKVKWKWGSGEATGEVKERFERDVERTIKGKKITRHGDENNPAYLLKQDDGDEVLKLGSELDKS